MGPYAMTIAALLMLGAAPIRAARAEHDAPAAGVMPAPTPAPAAPAPGAEDVDPEARRLSAEGKRAFDAGRYAEAIAAFKTAYQRTPAPGLLYNMAQAYRMQENCALALETYRRFLDTNPAGALRQMAEERVAEMHACVVAQAAAVAPAPAPVPVPPTGSPAATTPNTPPSPDLAGRMPPPAPSAPPRARIRPRTVAAIAAGAIAAGLLAAGGYYAWQARAASDDVTQLFAGHQAWNGAAMLDEQRGVAAEQRAWGFGAAGLVLAGVTALLSYRR